MKKASYKLAFFISGVLFRFERDFGCIGIEMLQAGQKYIMFCPAFALRSHCR
jgi:hypothetical protein